MQSQAYDYLSPDTLGNIDLLESINRGVAKILYAGSDGVLLYNDPGDIYMISTENPETFETMCGLIENPNCICIHQTQFAKALATRFELPCRMDCYQYAYTSKTLLPENLSQGLDLRLLTQADADFVYQHYENARDSHYIVECIRSGMIGAFQGDELAGFIGTHAEGSVGLLEVLPAFRRRGIASTLQAAMINLQLAKSEVPYGQVEISNKVSLALQSAMNFDFSDKIISWVYLEL